MSDTGTPTTRPRGRGEVGGDPVRRESRDVVGRQEESRGTWSGNDEKGLGPHKGRKTDTRGTET